MKQTVGINLYRLSLIMILVPYLYASVEEYISGGHASVEDVIGWFVITFFILLASVALRVIALYLHADVRWWDFVAIVLSTTLLSWLFESITYGTSLVAIYPLFVAITAFILLIHTFFYQRPLLDN